MAITLIPTGTTVTVETKYFPPLTVALGAEPEPMARPSLGGLVTKALKPRVTVRYQGQTVTQVAPYGAPVPNEWPKVRIALAVIVALAVFSVLRVLK